MEMLIHEPEVIDNEWLELIMEARDIGLTVEDVRRFLDKNNGSENLAACQQTKTSYK
ncbi:anti-repressor SinI family protein [Neobacillus muris]|uniref:anti-repressor SinI family protein n=1 Tax=Neobacillus muris TaxID=2941334 RepID=UPI002041BD2E|nr:anti-repressor SinI family protein [Neobacillus muris]